MLEASNPRMDPNIAVLIILLAVAIAVGVVAAMFQSRRIRRYGFLGALRRRFSGGSRRSPYGN